MNIPRPIDNVEDMDAALEVFDKYTDKQLEKDPELRKYARALAETI